MLRALTPWLLIALAGGACVPLRAASSNSAHTAAPAALGQRLYLEGIRADGTPMRAKTQGDIAISGMAGTCARCHRRSGYGESEGGNYVPPITGPTLFSPSKNDRAQRFKRTFMEAQSKSFYVQMRTPHLRPAYDERSLAMAIRDGVDPTGRRLDPLMPRYRLDVRDMAALTAYLRTLSRTPSPGVDAHSMYLSTVISEGADSVERDAMLAVLDAYVAWKNRDMEHWTTLKERSLLYRDQFVPAYRRWQLKVWTLHGAPSTWRPQLDAAYAAQPVFAVVSGLVSGPWQPMHDFCEERSLPCLFPNTQLPVADGANVYSIYLSKGLLLEADALAAFVAHSSDRSAGNSVAQIYCADQPQGALPAHAFRRALNGVAGLRLSDLPFSDDSSFDHALARVAHDPTIDTLVIWPAGWGPKLIQRLWDRSPAVGRILLPSPVLDELLADHRPLPKANMLFSYPYALPTNSFPRAYRVQAWLSSRGIAVTSPRIQFDTYFVLEDLSAAVAHIIDNYSRDYLIEYIEHETENNLNAGVYPSLSLGPGQRFASKGAYVVRLDPNHVGGLAPVSGWIVP